MIKNDVLGCASDVKSETFGVAHLNFQGRTCGNDCTGIVAKGSDLQTGRDWAALLHSCGRRWAEFDLESHRQDFRGPSMVYVSLGCGPWFTMLLPMASFVIVETRCRGRPRSTAGVAPPPPESPRLLMLRTPCEAVGHLQRGLLSGRDTGSVHAGLGKSQNPEEAELMDCKPTLCLPWIPC